MNIKLNPKLLRNFIPNRNYVLYIMYIVLHNNETPLSLSIQMCWWSPRHITLTIGCITTTRDIGPMIHTSCLTLHSFLNLKHMPCSREFKALSANNKNHRFHFAVVIVVLFFCHTPWHWGQCKMACGYENMCACTRRGAGVHRHA